MNHFERFRWADIYHIVVLFTRWDTDCLNGGPWKVPKEFQAPGYPNPALNIAATIGMRHEQNDFMSSTSKNKQVAKNLLGFYWLCFVVKNSAMFAVGMISNLGHWLHVVTTDSVWMHWAHIVIPTRSCSVYVKIQKIFIPGRRLSKWKDYMTSQSTWCTGIFLESLMTFS